MNYTVIIKEKKNFILGRLEMLRQSFIHMFENQENYNKKSNQVSPHDIIKEKVSLFKKSGNNSTINIKKHKSESFINNKEKHRTQCFSNDFAKTSYPFIHKSSFISSNNYKNLFLDIQKNSPLKKTYSNLAPLNLKKNIRRKLFVEKEDKIEEVKNNQKLVTKYILLGEMKTRKNNRSVENINILNLYNIMDEHKNLDIKSIEEDIAIKNEVNKNNVVSSLLTKKKYHNQINSYQFRNKNSIYLNSPDFKLKIREFKNTSQEI